MGELLRISQNEGLRIAPAQFGEILRGHATRLVENFTKFDADRWAAPTRCSDWDAHTTFRHLADTAEGRLSGFTGEELAFMSNEGFDPQSTPDLWLGHSADDTPQETLARFGPASATGIDHIERELEAGNPRVADGPYGPAHWSTVSVHVLWDAWLHERDIVCVDPDVTDCGDPDAERRLVALYGVLMGTVPLLRLNDPISGTIRLDGERPLTARFGGEGEALVEEIDPDTDADVYGELLPVVDALAGRGSLHDVLSGTPELVEKLSYLGAFI